MPLTMPAAVIGIQSICTAHTVAPIAPNRNRSAISIRLTPTQLKREYRLRSDLVTAIATLAAMAR